MEVRGIVRHRREVHGSWLVDGVAEAGLASVGCEMVEDNVDDDTDPRRSAAYHHLFKVVRTSKEVANAISSRLKWQYIIIAEKASNIFRFDRIHGYTTDEGGIWSSLV